ncbi:MAG: PepSY-associated TM helix domain-containing protein [Calditrichia bacterium]|nr:PepSY-associated TM helix domain-containing protein [Calditrichia bacterium]
MNWRKLNRTLHRDFGYLFFGMTIIYALSGIALNHIKDWNSNYDIMLEQVNLQLPAKEYITKKTVLTVLEKIGEKENLKSYYFPSSTYLKIFFQTGSLNIELVSGKGIIERLKKRPVLFEMNFLHYNPGVLWKYFSDFFCISLVLIAITGLFVIKGKKGIKGRGAWLTGIGIIVPAIMLLMYL